MTDILQSEHVYEAAWRMPEDVERWIRSQCEGRVANICCGGSKLGDVRVDADVERNPDVLADMNNLPLSGSSFDTVVFDPPWKVQYFDRQKPFFECVRITKPGGLVLMNATWVGESDFTEIEDEIAVRADDEWSNVSAIVPHRVKQEAKTLHNFDTTNQ